MTARTETLSDLLVTSIEEAKPGHCLRVDDLTLEEASNLQEAVTDALRVRDRKTAVWVRVLDKVGGEGRVTIEQAVGLRNDVALPDEEAAILILLVPPSMAREASSLDNAFQRVPHAQLLEAAADRVVELIRDNRPNFPSNELKRLTRNRTPIENWLDFLEAVDDEPEKAFGKSLWRVGLVPDGGDDDDATARLRDNNSFVRKVIDPAGAGHAIRDRLRQTRLAPDSQFEQILKELTNREDRLDDAREWTKAIAENVGLKFDDFAFVETDSDSDLDGLEVLSFRSAAGTVPKTSGLVLSDGNLVCEISDESEGKVVVKWRTTPNRTTHVHRWLLRLLHPVDLQEPDETALVEMRVAGSKRSATLKLDLAAEDITGGFLFVVDVSPLDEDDQVVKLPDAAITQSEAFELLFRDKPSPEQSRASTATSLGAARLRAVSRGANSLDEDHAAWDWNRQQFSLRIGTSRSIQIPVNQTVVTLERQMVSDPTITGYKAESLYGLALPVETFEPLRSGLPATLAKKRKQVMDLLQAAEPQDVPEVLSWNDENRAAVQDYLATYKRALDSAADAAALEALQCLDMVSLSVGNVPEGSSSVTIVLPLHPIRLAWMSAYDGLTRAWAEGLLERADTTAGRKDLVDFDGLMRIAPTNIPFSVVTPQRELNVYFDELMLGTGLLLPIDHPAPEVLASTVSTVLGIERQSVSMSSDATMIGDRLTEYRKAHPHPKAIRLAAMHPGDSAVLAKAITSFLKRAQDDSLRLDVVAYGERDRYAEPLAALTTLQVERESQQTGAGQATDTSENPAIGDRNAKQSPLFPPVGASLRPIGRIATDAESIHVSSASGISALTPAPAPPQALDRFASLDDLLCPLVTTNVQEGQFRWTVSPALKPRTSTNNSSLVDAHRSHQTAAGSTLGLDGPPALHVGVSGDTLDDIRILHERSDWVLTLDRFVGLNFYESGQFGREATNYILDYAPDFIDGMSHRLTVTTSHRAEVTAILKRAMSELGLDALDSSSTQVLEDLMTVSGRLILRLQSSEGFARESVSLAALVSHLRKQDKLEGAIIVPVDSHHEIFGRSAPGNETGRRCDMLIVRVSQRKFRIECVEVKSRRYALLPTDLADEIADQLESTKALLEQRYFATDPARIDAPLQRAQLAGLLHYYADRAVNNGLIPADKVADTHKHIDSLVEGGVEVDVSMHGYVISLGDSEGIPAKHRGIPISVLTAADLGRLGFSVMPSATEAWQGHEDASERTRQSSGETGSPGSDLESSDTSTPGEREAAKVGEEGAGERVVPVPEPAESVESSSATAAAAVADVSKDAGNHVPTADAAGLVSGTSAGKTAETPRGASDVRVAVGRDSSGAEVTWAPSTKGSPHAFIVGIPGQGKSVTTRRLIRELADQNLPSLVIDFHGDMAADPPANAEVLRADTGLPFTPFEALESTESTKVNAAAWELAEVIQFVGSMGEIQRSNVYKALQDVYNVAITAERVPTLSEFATALEGVEQGGRAKNARERVRPLTDFGLFDETASRSFNPRKGGMIVDLSSLMLEEVQIAATSFLLRKIYRDMFDWPQDGTLKLAIVLDEAHRVAKDVTLPKLMKEGRKYGVVVLVASQGLADFHTDVLGNAGTKIVFRTNHPESKSVARYLRGRPGQDLSVEVEKLGVGQAYVATAEMPQARRTAMFK
ncbi:ATP-binding protein [Rhodococcus koreensis]